MLAISTTISSINVTNAFNVSHRNSHLTMIYRNRCCTRLVQQDVTSTISNEQRTVRSQWLLNRRA
jgi:hypothetical protein